MLIFILCLYIIRANGFIVPTAALCIAWAALLVRWTLRFIAACATKGSSPAAAPLCVTHLFYCFRLPNPQKKSAYPFPCPPLF